jgi:hypothetical protein
MSPRRYVEVSGVKAETQRVSPCWVGGAAMLEAQRIAAANDVLSHDSPEKAIAVFLGVVNYRRNRRLLQQMPPSLAESFVAGPSIPARSVPSGKRSMPGQTRLRRRQARRLLQAYGIARRRVPAGGQHRGGDPGCRRVSAIRSIWGWCSPMGPQFAPGRVGTALAGRDPDRRSRPAPQCADSAVPGQPGQPLSTAIERRP